ncbi:MAG TPA: XrtA/PEP-CTERM system histidine kinase PrsK [Steroidobacteraceae bacterium]|nr:XrtA/PEP-CTERM system histidine kinase PrsK [Steroidobacteraceae bacterium]
MRPYRGRGPIRYDPRVLGYLICAAVYALLLLACLTLWRRRLTGSAVATAVGVQLGWALVLAAAAGGVPLATGRVIAAEYLRDLTWAFVLARSLRRPGEPAGAAGGAQRAIALLVILVLLGSLWSEPPPFIRAIEQYWLWGGLALSIAGLVLLEQVVRNTRSSHRWHLKHVWLAIGGLYAWDLCLFSIAMLRGRMEDFWVARGFVNAALGGLLAVGLRRIGARGGWESAAFLSPRVVFFNATLLAASLYVLAMAAGSYFIRELGGTWGGAGQLLFLAAGALVLAIAVLSEQFRAWSRVTLARHLFPYRYDYRDEWQKLTRALSQSGELPVYERIVKVMAGFVSAVNGGLWLRDPDGVYVPVGGDLAPPGAPAPQEADCRELFDSLLQKEWICDLEESRGPQSRMPQSRAPQANAPALTPPRWMIDNPRMWLLVPLICEQALVGFVVVGQPLAAVSLGWEEIGLLRAAGRQVASFLAFEQAAKRLAEAHQFEAMNRLSAVLMHDLRHLIAQQALVVQNAARHRGNPEFFDDAILTIDNSVKRMTRLMDELRSGALTGQTHRVELTELCAEAVRRCAGRPPEPSLQAQERGIEVVVNRERLLQVLEHVIRNAQEATPPDGSVSVRIARAAQQALIEVADTGTGMDAEFIRTRLFRPFDTTKGERGFGIGAFEAREFVRKCGGSITVESTPGKGTRFMISIPLAPALAPAELTPVHELQAN